MYFFGQMTKEAVNEKIPPKRGDLQNTHRKKFRNKHTLDASAQLQDFPSEVPEEESDSTTGVTPASSLQSSAVPCAVNLWIALYAAWLPHLLGSLGLSVLRMWEM